jgi:hypothetical protein
MIVGDMVRGGNGAPPAPFSQAMIDLTPFLSLSPYIALLVALALIPAAYR